MKWPGALLFFVPLSDAATGKSRLQGCVLTESMMYIVPFAIRNCVFSQPQSPSLPFKPLEQEAPRDWYRGFHPEVGSCAHTMNGSSAKTTFIVRNRFAQVRTFGVSDHGLLLVLLSRGEGNRLKVFTTSRATLLLQWVNHTPAAV